MSTRTIFCRFCGAAAAHRYGQDRRRRQRYKCAACCKVFTNRTNTVRSGSRLSAREWELSERLFASRGGMSGTDLSHILGYGRRTGQHLNRSFRQTVRQLVPSVLPGASEWDESIFSGQWVLGGVSRALRQCLLRPIPDRSERTLVPLVEQATAPESLLITDEWGGYLRLVNHMTVCHERGFVADYCRAIHTNTQEGIWGHAKTLSWHVYRGFKRATLPEYLSEVMFRYNIRSYPTRVSVLLSPPLPPQDHHTAGLVPTAPCGSRCSQVPVYSLPYGYVPD